MSLHISLLGHFALIANGHPLFPVLPPRLVELIAYLVLFAVQEQPRRNVAFMLWPDTTEAQAQANLRKLLYQLRAELPPVAAHVQATARHLKWEAGAAVSCDVHTFDAALTAAHKAATGKDLAGEYAELQAATAAYGGDLLPGHEAEWLLAPRERLRRSYIAALGRLIDLLESRREYAAAVDVARRLVETDPLHEASYRILMRLHASSGDRASALHVYHTCATVLQRELGISPSPSTQVAYQDLLAATAPEAVQVSALPSKIVEPGLVGRRGEWARLQEAWSAARSGRASLTLLVGEGGIGKTRLAEEFHAWALRQGITTAAARCYATEEGLAYAPVITWLRALRGVLLPAPWQQELGRLLPEFAEGAPRPADYGDEGGQQRLFEALARAVLAVQPCLLIVDDLQWCDQATLVWLHYLLRFDPRAQLLVLGTVRPEEVGDAHQLHPLLSSLQKAHRLWEIPLGPLNQDETVHLASAVAAQEIGPQRAARLYQESEGNPLLIVEMMRAELDPAPQTLYAGWGQPRAAIRLPGPVQALLMGRLAQLSPAAREVVNVAAVIGRQFTFPVLARTSRREDEELVYALDELWKRQIIREQGEESYDFSHDKLREVAYTSLGLTRRRMLHRYVAQAMLDVYGDVPGPVSSEIASHFEQAGSPADAVHYYAQAGEAALRVLAPAVASAAFEHAIRLLPIAEQRAPEYDWVEAGTRIFAGLNEAMKQISQLAAKRLPLTLSELRLRKIDRVYYGFDWDEDGLMSEADHESVVREIARVRGWEPGSGQYEVVRTIYMTFWQQMEVVRLTHEDFVTRDEYRAYIGAMVSDPEAFIAASRPPADFIFDLFDTGGDGMLSMSEYWEYLRVFRGKKEELADTFARLDLNGDGMLSKDEFHQIWIDFHISNDPEAPGNWMLGSF